MPKRAKLKMMPSTYVPAAKAAAALVLAIHGQEPEPAAPTSMQDVGQGQQPTLRPQRKAG